MELNKAIDSIRMLKRKNKYFGSRIGKIKTLQIIPPFFSYRLGDFVLYTDEGNNKITISRPWREQQLQVSPGITESVGAETIVHLPKDSIEDYDNIQIPKGLYERSNGIGRVILRSIDALVRNGHREAAFLLLLNVIAGLSRRRYPISKTNEGLIDRKKHRHEVNLGNEKSDKDAFTLFIDTELNKLQGEHPEYGLDFSDTSLYATHFQSGSVGEWLYEYFRCMLIHNTETSSKYKLDMNCDSLFSIYYDLDNKIQLKCLGFGFINLLREIVASAEENDESF